MAMTASLSLPEQNARRFMAIAATLGVIGIAFNLNGDGTLPKILAGVGIVAMIWSIHRFGRLGPDAPLQFAAPEPAEPPRKKRKKKKRAVSDSAETPPADESSSNDGM
jgi:hypothetical protein